MLLVLYLQNKGFRLLEALVITLVATVGACFAVLIWIAKPRAAGVLFGFIPPAQILDNPAMLYIAIGILGATVMPHNLYLHSSIVQTRKYEETANGKQEAVKLRLYRFDDRAVLCIVHQRRDPHRGSGELPYERQHGSR